MTHYDDPQAVDKSHDGDGARSATTTGPVLPTTRSATADEDLAAVQSFVNFLSWASAPATPSLHRPDRHVPPAWYAYALGATRYCPPVGVL